MAHNKAIKLAVLSTIAGGTSYSLSGRAEGLVKGKSVHVRYNSSNRRAPSKFKFNINPTTLSADFELWICGSAANYYLMPIEFIRRLYKHPDAYPDRQNPGYTVVSVDANAHNVMFAPGGRSESLGPYLGAVL